jgi:hypothetical protein
VRHESGDRGSLLEQALTRLRAPPQRERPIEELENGQHEEREQRECEDELDEGEAATGEGGDASRGRSVS